MELESQFFSVVFGWRERILACQVPVLLDFFFCGPLARESRVCGEGIFLKSVLLAFFDCYIPRSRCGAYETK